MYWIRFERGWALGLARFKGWFKAREVFVLGPPPLKFEREQVVPWRALSLSRRGSWATLGKSCESSRSARAADLYQQRLGVRTRITANWDRRLRSGHLTPGAAVERGEGVRPRKEARTKVEEGNHNILMATTRRVIGQYRSIT